MPTAFGPRPGEKNTNEGEECGTEIFLAGNPLAASTDYPLLVLSTVVGIATLSAASSRSIVSFTRPSANSAATRTAFLMALVFDDPCVMMHTPFTPSNGAPP